NALRKPSKIHVICTRNSKGETNEFREPLKNPEEARRFQEYLRQYRWYVGHNLIQYDLLNVLDPLLPGHPVCLENVIDTLVVSRLLNYNRPGGHSIRQYGEEFGIEKKGSEIEQWDILTDEMVERCHSDTEINWKILDKYWRLITDSSWDKAIELEQYTAYVCGVMTQNGFGFDVDRAVKLKERIQGLLAPIDQALADAFPPRPVAVREVCPRINKNGTFNLNDFRWYNSKDLTCFNGGPFTIIKWEEFNPGSIPQIIDRLHDAG